MGLTTNDEGGKTASLFFEKYMKLTFKHLLTVTTTFIAGCAAFFSVWGIGKLFAGASVSTMIMAASLEAGKIVAVTFLYRYWAKIKLFFRSYLLVGALLLMVITSMGIYGYLSAAYASAALGFQSQRGEISLLETQQNSVTSTYTSNLERIKNNDERIRQLQQYRLQQETRLDSLVGRNGFVTQQNIVRQADVDIRRLQAESRDIEKENVGLLTRRDSLESVKLVKETETNTNSKLGTFWYIAEAIGVPLDTVVKWFILMIVLVFDPLSIALVIAYNVIKRTDEDGGQGDGLHVISHPVATGPLPESVITSTSVPDDKTQVWVDMSTPTPRTIQTEFIEPEIKHNLTTTPPVNYLPYYLQPDFDWSNKELWESDPEARQFNEQRLKSR